MDPHPCNVDTSAARILKSSSNIAQNNQILLVTNGKEPPYYRLPPQKFAIKALNKMLLQDQTSFLDRVTYQQLFLIQNGSCLSQH